MPRLGCCRWFTFSLLHVPWCQARIGSETSRRPLSDRLCQQWDGSNSNGNTPSTPRWNYSASSVRRALPILARQGIQCLRLVHHHRWWLELLPIRASAVTFNQTNSRLHCLRGLSPRGSCASVTLSLWVWDALVLGSSPLLWPMELVEYLNQIIVITWQPWNWAWCPS